MPCWADVPDAVLGDQEAALAHSAATERLLVEQQVADTADLRTVLVSDIRDSVVLLPAGRLDVVLGKLLHGSTCAHHFWDQELATEGDDFAVPASQVVARRAKTVAGKPRYCAALADGALQLTPHCQEA